MTEQSNGAKKASASPAAIAKRAAAELADLLSREPEGVIGLRRTDDGWCVDVEVVEVHRIPDTGDIIARYEVDADRRGRLLSYNRVRRYRRDQTGADE